VTAAHAIQCATTAMRRGEAPKIRAVEGQEATLAVCQHRCHGVVDLAARKGITPAQHDEPIPHQWTILENRELPNERRGVGRSPGRG
jgi:hypothetical protein